MGNSKRIPDPPLPMIKVMAHAALVRAATAVTVYWVRNNIANENRTKHLISSVKVREALLELLVDGLAEEVPPVYETNLHFYRAVS